MLQKVRVRFAPSPTGGLHIGGVRTALYNYLFAKKHGGDFLLRIEDTDQNRFVEGAEEYIREALKWCGIEPNEGVGYGGEKGPYRQSERKDIYKDYAEKLVATGHAYYAFDTPEELTAEREKAKENGIHTWQYDNASRNNMKNSLTLSADQVEKLKTDGVPAIVRFKMPQDEKIIFTDEIRGEVVYDSNVLDDKVLFKADGMPTYHLANIVDDHLMEITHIIRGEEWLPSAPLHVMLYRAFGWEHPKFAHLPLIMKPVGNGKLSKRDGDKLGFPVFPLSWQAPGLLTIDVENFTIPTEETAKEYKLRTAHGLGNNGVIFLPDLVDSGIAPSANWNFVSHGKLELKNDGTAYITGIIANDIDASLTFEVDIKLQNKMNWTSWSALGRTYSDNMDLSRGEHIYEDWTFFEMVEGSQLKGTNKLRGSNLLLSNSSKDFLFGFQLGKAANNKNRNIGIGGLFNYKSSISGINIEKQSIIGYREDGYLPEAMINMLLMLGWNEGTEQEIYSLEDAASAFSLERVIKSGAKFSPEKAKWFNEQYLRNKSNEELAELVKPIVEDRGVTINEKQLVKMINLTKERSAMIQDLVGFNYLFEAPTEYDAKTVRKKWKDDTAGLVEELKNNFAAISDFTEENINQVMMDFMAAKEIGFGKIGPGLRLVLTGVGGGPSLPAIAAFFGKEETISRIENGTKDVLKLKAENA